MVIKVLAKEGAGARSCCPENLQNYSVVSPPKKQIASSF